VLFAVFDWVADRVESRYRDSPPSVAVGRWPTTAGTDTKVPTLETERQVFVRCFDSE